MSEERAYNPADGMMSLKGKAYLPVAERIVWFRNDYPEGSIETILVELDREAGYCMFRAEVATGQGGRATATGTETARDFGDYIEKAETKAVGRALGYLGYGTASAGFEEGHRIVDTPQPARPARDSAPPVPRPTDRAAAAGEAAASPLTAEEFEGVLDRAWKQAEDGKPLIKIRDALNAARHNMSKEQRALVLVELQKITERFYPATVPEPPASIAG